MYSIELGSTETVQGSWFLQVQQSLKLSLLVCLHIPCFSDHDVILNQPFITFDSKSCDPRVINYFIDPSSFSTSNCSSCVNNFAINVSLWDGSEERKGCLVSDLSCLWADEDVWMCDPSLGCGLGGGWVGWAGGAGDHGRGRKGRVSEVGCGTFGGEPRKEKLWAVLYFRTHLYY